MKIEQNVPLKEKNWFQTGGPAKFYCEPTTDKEFKEALDFAKNNKEELFILGDGANILISDDGFDGLVIHPQLKNISHKDNIITAESGALMEDLIEYCLDNNLVGLEEFSNIPGSIGGAVYINLHYFEFFLADFLVSATLIEKETGNIITVDKDWFEYGYDDSRLMNHYHYVIDATFKLKSVSDVEIAYARGRRLEITRHRMSRYPNGHTCGSFFRNFEADEVTLESNGKQVIWVAYYLDKIGVKGVLKQGDTMVSYQHANMLVNNGNATSADLIILALTMQELVKKEFGIVPQPECLLVGFKGYPLLK
jgi:UDP-N-acetylmuramate dehydrogenase